ncbi:MAG: hypothetical protein HYZ29_36775 [Myxococcales bacterium]|nr:hypothetical protein [Myxococcales bacterium]
MPARRLAFTGAVAALMTAGVSAHAAGPLGPDGSPITTSDYRIDLSRGVVLAGTRVLGLAGAYVAIAEGVDGNSANPVAPAMRSPNSYDHFDYDLGFGLTFPSAVSGTDLFNSGDRTSLSASQKDALFVDLAANLQFGRWGTGVSLHYTTFEVAEPGGQSLGLAARFGGVRLQVARSWFDGQFLLGLGSRGTGLVIRNENPEPGEPAELFNIEGASAELGALYRPNDAPFRVGVAARSAVVTNQLSSEVPANADGDRIISRNGTDLYLPNEVTLPWDIDVGLAVQLGPRPLNPRWVDPDRALARLDRYLAWKAAERRRRMNADLASATPARAAALEAERTSDEALDEVHRDRAARAVRAELRRRARVMERFYVLVSSSLAVTGPVRNSVGIESFIERRVERSGRKATYTPRLGIESEVVPRWLRLRAGTYGEPTRFESQGARARLHGTLGFDQKLFPWTVFGIFDDDTEWKLSAALDGARHYLGWGVSVGIWR